MYIYIYIYIHVYTCTLNAKGLPYVSLIHSNSSEGSRFTMLATLPFSSFILHGQFFITFYFIKVFTCYTSLGLWLETS